MVHINGSLHKMDKFWRIHLFCDETHISDVGFCVLIMTNAANISIDKASIALQMGFDWPRNLLTYLQECGHGSCKKGTKPSCILYADLSSYVFLLSQLIRATDATMHDSTSAPGETDGFNSAILPRQQIPSRNTSKSDFALGGKAKKRLCNCTYSKLKDVLKFFCLDFGCQHEHGELFLSNGCLYVMPITG
jgi:hypothetical protein